MAHSANFYGPSPWRAAHPSCLRFIKPIDDLSHAARGLAVGFLRAVDRKLANESMLTDHKLIMAHVAGRYGILVPKGRKTDRDNGCSLDCRIADHATITAGGLSVDQDLQKTVGIQVVDFRMDDPAVHFGRIRAYPPCARPVACSWSSPKEPCPEARSWKLIPPEDSSFVK